MVFRLFPLWFIGKILFVFQIRSDLQPRGAKITDGAGPVASAPRRARAAAHRPLQGASQLHGVTSQLPLPEEEAGRRAAPVGEGGDRALQSARCCLLRRAPCGRGRATSGQMRRSSRPSSRSTDLTSSGLGVSITFLKSVYPI